MPMATLSIAEDRIVMTPRGYPSPTQLKIIVRRPDSRLRVEFASNATTGPTSFSWNVMFDVAVKKPRIVLKNFGEDRVKKACIDHCWVFADAEQDRA